jgi:hypothetical protein
MLHHPGIPLHRIIVRFCAGRFLSVAAAFMLIALAAVFLRQMAGRALRPIGNDLTAYLLSARALLDGTDPYRIPVPQGYLPYPLTLATVLIPFVWLPSWAAQIAWFALNVGALLAALVITEGLWRAVAPSANPFEHAPFLVRFTALVLVLEVSLQSHLSLGQANLIVLALCCLFVRAHLAERRGAASVWLGAAMAVKLTPLLFLVSLARERTYRTLLLTVGALLIWTIALPLVVSDRALALYRDEWLASVEQYVTEPVTFGKPSRFTVAAALVYLWPPVAGVPGLRYVAAALVVGPLLWLQGRVGHQVRSRLLVFGLYLLATLLISPLSETHHLVVLAVPLWLWSLAAAETRLGPVDRVGAMVFLACHWLAVWHRVSLFDVVAMAMLYAMLFIQALSPDNHVVAGLMRHATPPEK